MRQTIVIVGAGVAGGTAALTLRSQEFDGRIVVVGDEAHPPYSRPPLSKAVLRGDDPPERAYLRPPAWFTDRDIELVSGVAATTVDPVSHVLHLADGTRLPYDQLLLATGGRARTLASGPSEPEHGVHTLRTLDDAEAIGGQLRAGRSLLVVGGGFIGAEVAASARALGCDVTVLEALASPMARMLPMALGQVYADIHREEGVDVRIGVGVSEVQAGSGGVQAVATDGRTYEADLIVVGIGMVPSTELAERAGLAVNNGIVVDEYCATSAPDIFAAGDVTNHPNPFLGRRIRVEHWQNAQHQGAAAARNMLGQRKAFAEVPWVWSEQYAHNLQITGDPSATDEVHLRGDVAGRSFCALLFRDGKLCAGAAVNRADEIRAVRRLIGNGRQIDQAVLCDEGTDLTQLSTG